MIVVTSPAELFPVLTALDFDVREGVEYCGSDEEFYCDLIRELHSDVLVKRGGSLEGGDLVRRREYAHLLKGTLRVLGERRASTRARDLEQALRNQEPHDDLTQKLMNDLDRIDRMLGEFFSEPTK